MIDDPLFRPLAWRCHVCGRLRLDECIDVHSRDASAEMGLPPGTVRINVRYCNDDAACATQAPHVRFFTPRDK